MQPNEFIQQVSHETIYAAIYAQPYLNLRRQLTACLRRPRSERMSRSRTRTGAIRFPA
jgi:hypothetical protein